MATLASSPSTNTTTAAASTAVTVTAATGTVMVATITMSSGGGGVPARIVSTVTDTGGNTWTKRGVSQGQSGQPSRTEIWTAPVTTALTGGTVTVTYNGSTAAALVDVAVVAGVTETGMLTANDNANNVTASSPAAVTVTPTGSGIVIGGITVAQTAAPTSGPGTGFTTLAAASSLAGEYGASAYQINATGGTYGPAWGWAAAAFHGAVTIFLPDTAAAAGPVAGSLLMYSTAARQASVY